MLRGVVHDPTARRMDGVAGHAGLFSTRHDLSKFCRMLLGGGALNGVRILSPLTVAKMTTRATEDGMASRRGLGWDIDSAYSSNRGELFPIGSFGHTGFTGTSLWIDPVTRAYVVFLSNRVHPDGKGDVTPLRARVATVVASALRDPAPATVLREQIMTGGDFGASGAAARATGEGRTLNGVDVLLAERVQSSPGQDGRAPHQPHWAYPHRRDDHRCAGRRARREAGRAVQPGAWHPRRPGREGRYLARREDRAPDLFPLRCDAAPDR